MALSLGRQLRPPSHVPERQRLPQGEPLRRFPCYRETLDRDHRDDAVVSIDNDDLITDDEVHVTPPFRIVFHQNR